MIVLPLLIQFMTSLLRLIMDKKIDIPFKNSKFAKGPDNKKIFVLQEKGKEYKAINKELKLCLELQIDKGIINNQQENKCDKGLIVLDDNKCILVEFKGGDVSTACVQLDATLDKFSKDLLADYKYEYYCRAVVTGMPSPNNYPTSYKILLKKLKNDKNKLICKTKKLEEII